MKPPKRVAQAWITGLSLVVALLALAATTAGIFTAAGVHHRAFVSVGGETVAIQGGGLYAHESVSGAAQAIAQDWVTLLVAIPLLLVTAYAARSGSVRARLARAGALWYFTYTYLVMAMGGAYNAFFLVYVALYSASLAAFILSLFVVEVQTLPSRFSPGFARRAIGWLLIGISGLLLLLWLGRIVPALIAGRAPYGLDAYSTLFVQAADLGLVVPLGIAAGALLLRRHPVGYLLAAVLLVKGATLGLALVAMALGMIAAGVPVAAVELVVFPALTLLCLLAVVHFFSSLAPDRPAITLMRHRV